MSWSEGLLQGFSTVNNAIQGWEDRKESKKYREEERLHRDYRETVADNQYQDERDYRNQHDKKTDDQRKREFELNYGLKQQELRSQASLNQQRLSLEGTRLSIAAETARQQQALNELNIRKIKQSYEDDKYNPVMQQAMIALKNGDTAEYVRLVKTVPPRIGGVAQLMINNPKYAAAEFMPAYQDSFNLIQNMGSDANVSELINSPRMLNNLNIMSKDSLTRNVGTQGKYGEITEQQIVGVAPVPGENGKPMQDKFTFILRSYNKDGKYYDAPVTEFRTSSDKDNIIKFTINELIDHYSKNARFITEYLQSSLPGIDPAKALSLTGREITLYDDQGNPVRHHLTPGESVDAFTGAKNGSLRSASSASSTNKERYDKLIKVLGPDSVYLDELIRLHPDFLTNNSDEKVKATVYSIKKKIIKEKETAEFKKAVKQNGTKIADINR